jgi:DNA-binding GntR family transcriptional regulator
LQVSRGPLREALARLASTGVIELEPYRGATVRRLKRQEVTELFEVREVLEGHAARLAAGRLSPQEQEQFRAFGELFRSQRVHPDAVGFAETNTAFHQAIIDASGNDLLRSVVEQLSLRTFRMQFRSLVENRMAENALEDHELIIAALLRGDGPEAERLMRNHIRCSAERALSQPDHMFG